jgi:CheY-like chemotaxis protein
MIQEGNNGGAVISFVDMSEQRAAALARERAIVAAENLARVRSEFLSNMSHEIRTPINGVLGFAEIGYRNYQNSEKAKNAFEKILTSGKRLLGVINEVLDFSKIEAGKLNVERTTVALNEVIEQAVEVVQERADAKHLDLLVERAPDLPKTCLGDPPRIGQVLLNLLSNAVKFTDSGSVTLATSCVDNTLIFRVTDTGIGMSAEQLGQLFAPFQQADGSISRRFGGTGLGLTIAKRIAELMEGDIRVESQPDIGSTFEFRLPYVPANDALATPEPVATEQSSASGPRLAGITILVAEDEPINQQILEWNLTEDGARVVMVSNGLEAIERILQDGLAAYDIVLMDMQMPELGGLEATQQILELAPDLPIIGQTANAFAEDREKCLAAGMVGYIAKPINPEALVSLVLHHVMARRRG